MSTGNVSEWADLWRQWNEHERLWEQHNQSHLVWLLVQGAPAKRELALKQWSQNPRLRQPTAAEIDTLCALGDRLLPLKSMAYPLPDVYAAACVMKLSTYAEPSTKDHRPHAFRGTRNAAWPLIPSVQRPVDSATPPSREVLGDRYHQLALFCEVMRQLLTDRQLPADELSCMAIAQHYGVKSPLVDLTWSPWVALFFASHKGEAGDVGIVQCFSVTALRELLSETDYGFGQLRMADHLDFVPRIRAQQGFFVELPALALDTQLIPWDIRFSQIPGVSFEDEFLSITEKLIYPPVTADPFAPMAAPKLQRYEKFNPAADPGAAQFYEHLRHWRPDLFREHDPAFVRSVRWLAEFHSRLQSLSMLRVFERSLTRLRSAYGKLAFAAQDGGTYPTYRDYVDYYLSQAGEESKKTIEGIWEAMSVEFGAQE